jgi:hypothetical protein
MHNAIVTIFPVGRFRGKNPPNTIRKTSEAKAQ